MNGGMLNGGLQAVPVEIEGLTEAREHCAAEAKRTGLQQLLLRPGLGRVVVERYGDPDGAVMLSVDQCVRLLDQNAGSVGLALLPGLPLPIRTKVELIKATAESPPAGAA